MKGAPTGFWGKLKRVSAGGDVLEWHPLIDHCADVGACTTELLGLPTWRRRLARIAGRADLDNVTCARLSVLAVLHDLGKFNLGFQAIGRPDLGGTAGHVREGLAVLDKGMLSCLETLGEWGPGTYGLLVSSICHHGRPWSARAVIPYEPAFWKARAGLDPLAAASELVSACRTWFPAAFEVGPDLPENAEFEHAFAGLVMLADWIGSDATVFTYSDQPGVDRMTKAGQMAIQFMRESWLMLDDQRRSDNGDLDPFARVSSELRPRPAQAAMRALPLEDAWSITALESETGSGKTEAALARFVALYSAGAVDGLYFALPTRTAATQMYSRIYAVARRAFTCPPPVLLAVPGYLSVDDGKGRKLPNFAVLWPDENRFRYRAWAAETPKRYLAGCIVVGTVDQVLLSSLRVRHAHLRATSLLRQFLVVDEVHASDAYMTQVLEDVLARHVKAGGHALLLSATLSAETRARLLSPGERIRQPDLASAIAAPYPLVSHRGSTNREISVERGDRSRHIHLELLPSLEAHDDVALRALSAARLGAKVLVVKNTVSDCLETQRELERIAASDGASAVLFSCESVIAPHHSRFARADREVLDKALERRFGKERDNEGCVIVATQTVQQSLDLDADLLLTDLCPMDVLLQRVGRLHRHARSRTKAFENALAVVIVPAMRDLGALLGDRGIARHHHGLGTVYPDLRVLEATWRLLEADQRWRIPEMSRSLVEGALHSSALKEIVASADTKWQAHAEHVLGNRRGESRQADLNLIDWTIPYSETSFPDHERVPTRLGEGDRRVPFEQPFSSPFGCVVNELTVRASWAAGIPSDVATATGVAARAGVTRFQFGDRRFIYDRHGLRRDSAEADGIDDDGP